MESSLLPITSFCSGELSPRMAARYDDAIYHAGLSRFENFMPFSQGGATLRPGTFYVGTPAANTATRLIPFIVSSDEAYVLELTNLYMRIWHSGALVPGQYFTTPWTTSVLYNIQVAQIGSRLIFAEQGSAPRELTRTALNTFTGATGALPSFLFTGPTENATTETPSWANGVSYATGAVVRVGGNYYFATVGGVSGVIAPSAQTYTEALPFTDGTVKWRWYQEAPFVGTGNYPGVVAMCNGRLWFAKTANYPQRLWASQPFDYGNFFYFDILTYTNQQMKDPLNWYAAHSALGNTLTTVGNLSPLDYLGDPAVRAAAGISFHATRSGGSGGVYGVVTWSAINVTLDHNLTTDTGDDDVCAQASKMWTFSTWQNPAVADFETVTIRRDITNPASAIMIELASDQNDSIQWMATGRALVIGTLSGEWLIPEGITATSVQAVMQTRYGSAQGLQGLLVNDSVVFLQGGAKRLREYHFSNEAQAYQSPDLTFYADHILGTGVKDLDFTQVPEPTLWMVRIDGVLSVLLYNRQVSALAWSRFVIGGAFESLAVVPSSTSGDDDVYVATIRGGVHFIERFAQAFSGYHVDNGVHVDVALTAVDGLARFGTVDIVDTTTGIIYPSQSVIAGSVPVPFAARGHSINVGALFTGYLDTMQLAPTTSRGTSQGQPKRVVEAITRVIGSYPFSASGSSAALEAVVWPDGAASPYTGDAPLSLPSEWSRDGVLHITASGLPCTIIGIVAEVEAL